MRRLKPLAVRPCETHDAPVSLVAWIKGTRGASGFGYGSTAEAATEGIDLSGKNILITGSNSGIGLESARVLALRGARVFAAARSVAKAEEVCKTLAGDPVALACELSQPASVRACVQAVLDAGTQVDVVLCNAGIMALPERSVLHGQELQFLTNHIGHFMLVTGLLGSLSDTGRVVMLSSAAHSWAPKGGIQFDDISFANNYSGTLAYGQSKLANLLFAKSLAKRFVGSQRTANAVHPGVIATNLVRHMNPVVRALMPVAQAVAMKSIPQGAATQCYVAAHPSLKDISGEYFADCNVTRPSRLASDAELAERLWQVSEEIVAGF